MFPKEVFLLASPTKLSSTTTYIQDPVNHHPSLLQGWINIITAANATNKDIKVEKDKDIKHYIECNYYSLIRIVVYNILL